MRLEDINALMEMSQPFAGVWLPKTVRIGFEMAFAVGNVKGRYSSEDYEATKTTKEIEEHEGFRVLGLRELRLPSCLRG